MEKEIIAGALFLLTFISPPPIKTPTDPISLNLGETSSITQTKKTNITKIQRDPKTTPVIIPQFNTKRAPAIAREPLSEVQINFLGICESGMSADRNSGNGYYGAFQFSINTWNSMNTGYERADLAPIEVQINAVKELLSRSSIWTQFPGCAAKMQSAGIL